MKIRITAEGHLQLERAGELKFQNCPFDTSDDVVRCGDWCPLFGEPSVEVEDGENFHHECEYLELCQTRIYGDIEDLRE